MINDTYTVRISGDGWASALLVNYSWVFTSARAFVAKAIDVPEWQVTIHSVTSGSLVISFSVNQFQPRYKNTTEVQQQLMRGNTNSIQTVLRALTNGTEVVVPIAAVWQATAPMMVPQSCGSTCVALIVSCVCGSVGLLVIGCILLVKLKLYYPLDYDPSEAAAVKKEDARRRDELALHAPTFVNDSDDERRPGRVVRDTIVVRSMDPSHYHLEGLPAPQLQPAPPYLIYGRDAGADVTPHAVSDDEENNSAVFRVEKDTPRHETVARRTSLSIDASVNGSDSIPRLQQHDDSEVQSTDKNVLWNEPLKSPRLPDPALVAKIKRPKKGAGMHKPMPTSVTESSPPRAVAVTALPLSPSPPTPPHTTTHSFTKWSVSVGDTPAPQHDLVDQPQESLANIPFVESIVVPPRPDDDGDEAEAHRLGDDDVTFIDVVEVGSAMEEDD
jgi:hypothetical protein